MAVKYNPMTGQRTDLYVEDEPTEVADRRWTRKRIDYLEGLLAGDLSDVARACYARELASVKGH